MPFANDCLSSGYSTLRDVPQVTVDQRTVGDTTLTLYDPATGVVINLSDYDVDNPPEDSFTGVKCVIRELPEDSVNWAEPTVVISDALGGVVTISYDEDTTDRGGIYTAEIQLWSAGHMRRALPFFFVVNPDLQRTDSGATLTIAEVRMTMRDVDPEGNFLLDQIEFPTKEIALCMRKCIDYWNETLPPVGTYKPTNFPYRYHYAKAVISQLYFIAAQNMLRNDLNYNAGGVTVQDTLRWKSYMALSEQLWNEWKQWVKDVKYNINIMGGFVVLGGYRREAYYR
jgi:hypothetical protein